MRVAEAELLIVPGLGNSGPDHWQSRWQERLSTARRIEQTNWDSAGLGEWTERIIEAVAKSARPVVLIGHSLGVPAIAHAAGSFESGKVRGAFLVAPPSEEKLREVAGVDPAFAPFPRGPLSFPALLVASRNDHYANYRASEDLALDWGANLVDAGEAGHINADSGHGPWPEGLMRFATFMAKL
jgi:predicted alpha/beta hydrolase family esterase